MEIFNQNTNQNFVQKKETNGVALAGLIVSIVALICSPIPLLCWILWIVGLILSCVGLGKKARKKLAVAGLLISIIDFIVLIVMLFVGAAAIADASEEMNKPKVETVVDNSVNHEWEYDSNDDEMTNSKSYFATISSDNGEVFGFPYDEEGGSHLMVTVRQTKKYGTEVLFGISKGQFLTDIDGQYVSVKFDDNAPKKYKANNAGDGSSNVIFIDNAKDFIAKAKTAKTIKIETQFYQEGNRVFTFTADEPLKWEH